MKNRILILANSDVGLYKFRKELLEVIREKQEDVYVALPYGTLVERLKSQGYMFRDTPMERRGRNPFSDICLFGRYRRLVRELQPRLVLTYTIKPNIYGALAAGGKGIPCVMNITGLGTAFQKRGVIRKLVIWLYRRACRYARVVLFENREDQEIFVRERILEEEKCHVLPGAGVNLEEYPVTAYPLQQQRITFLFVGRVMKEKGILELLEAFAMLRRQYEKVQLKIIGPCEEEKLLPALQAEGIAYYGYQEDVKPFLAECHCLVLPSYHEGMSNTLLEAGAMGRPLITSDIAGCREAVRQGKNGFLVPVGDAEMLRRQMECFFRLPYEEKKQMGASSRRWMELHFDKKRVIKETEKYLEEATG